MLYVSLKDGPVAGCGAGSSCNTVLKSQWAYLLPGVPVTAPALFTYLALLFGLIFKPKSKAWGGVLLVGSFMVIGAAFWFVGLQAFAVGSFCIYCMTTHAIGTAAAVCILLWLRPIDRELLPLGLGAAAMGLGMMAGAQIILPQKTTRDTDLNAAPATSGRIIDLAGVKIDTSDYPHSGNPESLKTVTLFFDYTCSSCRRAHGYLSAAEARFGKENYFVVLLPTPLHPDCNRYFKEEMFDHRNSCTFASLAMAIWSVAPEKFHEFDKWMIETGTDREPPDVFDVRAKAAEIVGEDVLAAALEDPSVAEKVEVISGIWERLRRASGKITMPKWVWNSATMTEGDPGEKGLFNLMEDKLGIVEIE